MFARLPADPHRTHIDPAGVTHWVGPDRDAVNAYLKLVGVRLLYNEHDASIMIYGRCIGGVRKVTYDMGGIESWMRVITQLTEEYDKMRELASQSE